MLRSALLAAVLFAPVAAPAQEIDPITASRLSAEMFTLASEQRDTLLMIAAAKLRKQVAVEVVERAPERDGAAPDAATDAPLTWEAMLDAAAELAFENPMLTSLIEDVRLETTKGVRTGRVESYTSIRAGGTDTYRPLEFTVGAYADVYVEGSGVSDLNLIVRDAQGRLVCSDTDISAIAYCGWQPDQTQTYAVEVVNKGRSPSAYKLMTN
jgi:hypothetical protein